MNAHLDIKEYSSNNANAGWQLEQYIGQELLAYKDYSSKKITLKYWRSRNQHEVDFILNDSVAIEVKHISQVTERHLKGLRAISENTAWDRKNCSFQR